MQKAQPFQFAQFAKIYKTGIVLDTRDHDDFQKGHIPESVNIPLKTKYEIYTACLFSTQSIFLVTYKGKEKESILRLNRVGITNIKGYLKEGIEVWKYSKQKIKMISAQEFLQKNGTRGHCKVVDVRTVSEFQKGHLFNAINIPLIDLPTKHFNQLITHEEFYLHCGLGARSQIAYTYLRLLGYDNVIDIPEGYNTLREKMKAKLN